MIEMSFGFYVTHVGEQMFACGSVVENFDALGRSPLSVTHDQDVMGAAADDISDRSSGTGTHTAAPFGCTAPRMDQGGSSAAWRSRCSRSASLWPGKPAITSTRRRGAS